MKLMLLSTVKKMSVVFFSVFLMMGPMVSFAAKVEPPPFVDDSDITSEVQSKGGKIFNIGVAIGAIVAAISLIITAVKFMSGKSDEGKSWLMNTSIGMVILTLIGGIVTLALG